MGGGGKHAQTNLEVLHAVSCLVKKSKCKVDELLHCFEDAKSELAFVLQNLSNAILGLSVFGTDVTEVYSWYWLIDKHFQNRGKCTSRNNLIT